MISFCDIPLIQCKEHRDKYGKYAIGFSKNIVNKLNDNKNIKIAPISYFTKQQLSLCEILKSYVLNKNRVVGWFKAFEMIRNSKQQINYDECEWRMLKNDDEWYWSINEYRTNKEVNKPLFLKDNQIEFSIEDIRYIIVYQEVNIKSTIKRIRALKTIGGNKCSKEDLDLLISKVISFDYISKDFLKYYICS